MASPNVIQFPTNPNTALQAVPAKRGRGTTSRPGKLPEVDPAPHSHGELDMLWRMIVNQGFDDVVDMPRAVQKIFMLQYDIICAEAKERARTYRG